MSKSLPASESKHTPSAVAKHEYSPWRHGGWYVHTVRYPSGAIGCVSRNYSDGKWRIVCDKRANPPTFQSRGAAADAEYMLAKAGGQ